MLRLENIRAGYGDVEVLHDVDLAVPAGTAVALLGANGAGKSTLLKVAAGILRPTRGHVSLGGRRVERLADYARSRSGLCLIPEGRGIFRQLSVRENLSMFTGPGDLRAAIARAATAFPVLGTRLDQQAGTLSGGEQQMLALCRALVTPTSVIMADELSVGLAPVIVDAIFDAIRVLRSEGRSLLIVEQYVDRALDFADYVYVLHKGRMVFVGEPEQCRERGIFEQYLGSVA